MRRETAAKVVLQILLPGCTVEFIVTSITDAVAAPESYWFRSEKLDRKIGAESLLGWCTLDPRENAQRSASPPHFPELKGNRNNEMAAHPSCILAPLERSDSVNCLDR
jgi:hypothetical protein